ncbi:MAG: L,D-transpeptidase [Thermoleophilaceae bacterium]
MTDRTRPVARSSGFCRGSGALALGLLAGAVGCLAVAPAAQAGAGSGAAAKVAASQPLVALQAGHVARRRPSRHARRIEHVAARRPLTGVRTVLPALGGRNKPGWVRVRLPGRPNSHAGWIRTIHTRPAATLWHLSLDLSKRRVTVWLAGRVTRRFAAVIGTASTPTPRGRFFVEEGVALASWDAGRPYALATSARSNVLQEFAGGPGQIALHGTAGLAGALGSASSHGCVRLGTRAITWLARRIGGGVPLSIRR